jgi:hypothetical protein
MLQLSVRMKNRIIFTIIIIAAFAFSTYLMHFTFGYDKTTSTIRIASKLWSDFGSHIPLVRSFSYGDNLNKLFKGKPVEYPGFPGEPIRYHFGFYMLAGLLEKLGFTIDWAINIPSIIGFTLFLVMIYFIAATLFESVWVGILTLIFTLFNGSTAFLTFLKTHPVNLNLFKDIYTNTRFPTFGPWDGGLVTAFWHLNIYTNQRHLALSFGLAMVLLILLIRSKPATKFSQNILFAIIISLIMDLILFINLPAAAIAGVFLVWFFLVLPPSRIPLAIAGILSIPLLFFIKHVSAPAVFLTFKPGYLTHPPLNFQSIGLFWLANLGLHTILIPLGMILAPKNVKKLLIIPLIILFIVPNLIQFSPDMINNHKFFNFFIVIGGMFSAYVIVRLMRITRLMRNSRIIILSPLIYLSCLILLFTLTFSGVIDFFAVINDNVGGLNDIKANPDSTWILNHSQPDAIFLNSTWFYHPAALAGRSIFSGYPYFTWSYGYNKDKRETQAKSIYEAVNITLACQNIARYNISYIELSDKYDTYFNANRNLWGEIIKPIYRNDRSGVSIFDPKKFCR